MDTKKVLSGVIIAATAATYAMFGGGDVDSVKNMTPAQEMKAARNGDEIRSMRGKNSQIIKRDNGRIEARIYIDDVNYFDESSGTYKPIDMTIKERKNPFAKYKKYIDSGQWKAEWDDDSDHDYRFSVRGKSVAVSALFDITDIAVETKYTNNGVKQTYVLYPDSPDTLEWSIDYHSSISVTISDDIRFRDNDGYLFTLHRFIAWDADGKSVVVKSDMKDNVLTAIIKSGDYRYPIYLDPSVSYTVGNSGMNSGHSVVSYEAARDTTEAFSYTTQIIVGQTGVAGDYNVWRSFLSFDLSSIIVGATIDSMKLVYSGLVNNSDVDFEWRPVEATFGDGAVSRYWINDFNGSWKSLGLFFI